MHNLYLIDKIFDIFNVFNSSRPMYCDSTYADKPAGDIPVAMELRKNIEPLLSVRMLCIYHN